MSLLYQQVKQGRYRAEAFGNPISLTIDEWREILREYAGHCAYCGRKFGYRNLFLEHILPLIIGAPHSAKNVVPACRMCNQKKRSKVFRLDLWEHKEDLLGCLETEKPQKYTRRKAITIMRQIPLDMPRDKLIEKLKQLRRWEGEITIEVDRDRSTCNIYRKAKER